MTFVTLAGLLLTSFSFSYRSVFVSGSIRTPLGAEISTVPFSSACTGIQVSTIQNSKKHVAVFLFSHGISYNTSESFSCYCSLRSPQLGPNAFHITFGDSILPRMSRDFAIFMAKHLAGYYLPVNSNIFLRSTITQQIPHCKPYEVLV